MEYSCSRPYEVLLIYIQIYPYELNHEDLIHVLRSNMLLADIENLRQQLRQKSTQTKMIFLFSLSQPYEINTDDHQKPAWHQAQSA